MKIQSKLYTKSFRGQINEKASIIWDIALRPLERRERVAVDIVNLLAERNVCIADVDRIFALVKGISA